MNKIISSIEIFFLLSFTFLIIQPTKVFAQTIFLNSGINKSCYNLCRDNNYLNATSVGTDPLASNGYYWDGFGNSCRFLPADTNLVMYYANPICSGNQTNWTKCACDGYIGPSTTPTTIPTIVPTPTIVSGEQPPTPFLNLPWDYQSKGMSFSEAALAINSYFDHEYPLLSSTSLLEPNEARGTLTNYEGKFRSNLDYSRHDGYDYGRDAGTKNGEPVLAAASGCASYSYTGAGGNKILIDHANGFQTRYYHLQPDDLVTKSSACIQVTKGEQIGRVGFTGNVQPAGESGSHLHFMVVQDKNGDGDFDDNIPDGLTDPFGWQSTDSDPWQSYNFIYQGRQRTGNKSYYLFTKAIDNLSQNLDSNGGFFQLGHYSLDFPKDATDKNLNLSMRATPVVGSYNNLESIGSTISITAKDIYGNLVTGFQKAFNLVITYDPVMVFRFKPDTLKIYTSSDGASWTEVDNTVIDSVNYQASVQVDHLSYFALMAEKKDINPPVTTAILSGEKGQNNWYRSDVELKLDTSDGEDGLGVDYTAFKLNDGDWEEYKNPIILVDEGSYKIEFYSADLDENIEEVEETEFNIDKTLPEVNLSLNPSLLWPPDGTLRDVKILGESSDNVLIKEVVFNVEDEYNEIEPAIIDFGDTVKLEARRKGDDLDGREYIIKVTAFDLAGNTSSSESAVLVPHDQGI